jgi:hypothetical protein
VFELVGGVAPDAMRDVSPERVQQRRPVGDVDVRMGEMRLARRRLLVLSHAKAQRPREK